MTQCIQNFKIYDEAISSCQKLVQISNNYINFLKKRFKTSVAIEMFKTENQCKTPQVVGLTDGTRHTGKQGLRTLERA